MDKKAARPLTGLLYMLALLVYNVLLSFGVALLYMALDGTDYEGIVFTPWFTVLTQAAGFLLPLAICVKLTRGRVAGGLNELLPNMRLGFVNIVFIFALCLCLQPAMMTLSAVASVFFPNDVSGFLSDMQREPFIVAVAVTAVTPALCEEITFRGYIHSQFQPLDIKKAAVINGLFFAVIHLNPQQFLYALPMGIVFTLFVHYTRSIRASVLAHFLINATQLMLSYALDALGGEEVLTEPPEPPTTADLWLVVLYIGVIALVFMPAVIILFRSFVLHNRQRNAKRDMADMVNEVNIS